MRIKLRELEGILIGLDGVKFKMPTKTGYWLGKFSREAKEEFTNYSERRNDLLEKYGEKGEDGRFIMQGENSIKLTNISAYNKESKELGNIEIEIPFRLMPLEAFYPPEKVKDGKTEKEVESMTFLAEIEVLGRFMIPLGEEKE
jgi:hypothetical protein